MITDIQVKVEDKVASVIGSPVIICGNSDYKVTFTFDDEWGALELKTARFVYKRGGAYQFIDVPFSGRVVQVPILSNVEEVILGVYTGELHTTTPTRIICKKSILCDTAEPYEAPDEDIYQQLLETINNLELLPTVSKADEGKALMVREDGHWVVSCPDFMHNQKDGKLVRFFFGTNEEWGAWTGDKNDVLFIPTDDTTLEEILAEIERKAEEIVQAAVTALQTGISDGSVVVAKAAQADSATTAETAAKADYATSAESATTAEKANKDSNGNVIADTYLSKSAVNQSVQNDEWAISSPGLYSVCAGYNSKSHWFIIDIPSLYDDAYGPTCPDEDGEAPYAFYSQSSKKISVKNTAGDYGKNGIRKILGYQA